MLTTIKKKRARNLIVLLASSPFCDDHDCVYAYVSLSFVEYYFAYSTHCIEAIVHSITAEI